MANDHRLLPAVGTVLGIDVGFSIFKRTTGFCSLSWDQKKVDWHFMNAGSDLQSRQQALMYLMRTKSSLVAIGIDGPLRPNLETKYTYRAAEALLSRGSFQTRGKPGPSNGGSGPKLHEEATLLARFALRELVISRSHWIQSVCSRAIVESFPNLFLGVLCDETCYPKPTNRKWTDALYPIVRYRLQAILQRLLPECRVEGNWGCCDHEEIASLVCAFTALCFAAGNFVAVGDAVSGHIMLPPSKHWGTSSVDLWPWASTALRLNLGMRDVTQQFPGATVYEDGVFWS